MIGVVALNEVKMPPVWFEWGYMLTSAVYKEVFQQDGAPAHSYGNDCVRLVRRQHELSI